MASTKPARSLCRLRSLCGTRTWKTSSPATARADEPNTAMHTASVVGIRQSHCVAAISTATAPMSLLSRGGASSGRARKATKAHCLDPRGAPVIVTGQQGLTGGPMHGPATMDALGSMPRTVLLAFTALFSIVNPLLNAIIFNQMTADRTHAQRLRLARRVGLYSLGLMLFALWVGSYVLNFFGITLGALKVAGGLVIAYGAWRLLHAPERREAEKE